MWVLIPSRSFSSFIFSYKMCGYIFLERGKNGRELVGSLAWLETIILRCTADSSVRKQARSRIELSLYWLKG